MRFRRSLLSALALVVATALAVPASVGSVVAAEDDPIVIDLSSGAGTTTITYNRTGDFFPAGTHVPLVQAPGCAPVSGSGKLCIGAPVYDGEVEVNGISGRGLVAYGGAAGDALGWIIDEALEAIRATYGVPYDDRLLTYATADIRSYVLGRILDIFDRYAYGHTLTADEQRTFDFIENWVLETDRLVTRAAHEQYEKFQEEKCGYQPPSAPAFVDKPVLMPQNVFDWCTRAHNAYDRLFVFAPPQPSMAHFQAWGAYAHAQEVGIGDLSSSEAQRALMATVTSNAVMSGVGVAIGAAAITTALVGSSTSVALAVSGAYGAFTATGAAMTAYGAELVTTMVGATAPAAAASVVAIVIFGIVMTAIATWHFAEYVKVGTGLVDKMNVAAAATDPFGLDALRALGADRPIRGDLDPDELPAYRKQSNVVRLASLVTRWMSITRDGQVVPDATGVWTDNATTPRDHRFEIDDGTGFRAVDAITVPDGEGGFQEVRFNRSWMIVTPEGGEPRAALWFKFEGADGKNAFAARSIGALGGWVLTKAAGVGPGFWGTQTLELTYLDADGVLTKARIVPPQQELGGPHPTVVGPLVPGRVVGLRPNPVAADGSFDLARYQSDYAYAWEVHRLDEGRGDWVPVSVEDPDAYGTRFTPTEIGQYRAVVRMTDLVDEDAEVAVGLVRFRISAPEITADVLELHDDGYDGLELRMRFSEPVAHDEFTITLDWPREYGEAAPAPTTLVLECGNQGLDCETAAIPVTLQHTLSDASDLSAGVTVRVRNGYGSELTRTFPIVHAARPALAGPYIPPTSSQPGTVELGVGEVSAHLVAESGADPNYMLAEVVPGEPSGGLVSIGVRRPGGTTSSTVDLLDTGNVYLTVSHDDDADRWALGLWGQPGFEDVGSYEIPLVLVQSNGSVTPFLVRLEVSASPADRYRAVLVSTVGLSTPSLPNLQPQIVGGQAEWDAFGGEVCVTFQVGGMTDREERCGPVSDFIGDDGTPLPFPYRELLPTGVPAGAATATIQLVADDDDERVYGVGHEVWFSLTSGAPSITGLSWNAASGVASLGVQRSPQNNPITAVTCELDGATTPCWGVGGGAWAPPGLAAGAHVLTVWVDDSAGNYTSKSLSFTVPPKAGNPPPPATGGRGKPPGAAAPVPSSAGSGGDASDPADAGGSEGGSGLGTDDGDSSGEPGGGSEPEPRPDDGGEALDETPAASDGAGLPLGLWIALIALLVLGAAATVILRMRRRAA